jgi:hypothetical protein
MTYDPNVPNPPPRDRGNRTLYFIVGGLVVLAVIFVFIFVNNDTADDMQNTADPAATTEPATPPAGTDPATTEPVTPPPAPEAEPAPAPAPEGNTGGTNTNP